MITADAAPRTCWWELTRRCRLRCTFCRDAANRSGEGELSRDEALALAGDLVRLGVRQVVLTGGEPLLCEHWIDVAARLAQGGVRVRVFTSGWGFRERHLKQAREAGFDQWAVSIDGPAEIHNRLRPAPHFARTNSFDAAIAACRMILSAGASLRVVTQVNAQNVGHLPETHDLVADLGARQWQVHLCRPISPSARNESLVCRPEDLERIVAVLKTAARERRVLAPLHCTIGYMTEEEPILRRREMSGGNAFWDGCPAGLQSLAITPDGRVKGCVTLPDEFVTATVRERSLRAIWADDDVFAYTRGWTRDVLCEPCDRCAFDTICRAGCPSVAYGATGTIGSNPYCLKELRRS